MTDKPTPQEQEQEISVIRTPKSAERPYFSMARETAQDARLSWSARGILAYLLSKPDNWQVRVKNLQQKCGRDKVKAVLKELENAGYLTVERLRHDEAGNFLPNRYLVHETPFTEKPSTVEPSTVNPSLKELERGDKPKERQKTEKDTGPVWYAIQEDGFKIPKGTKLTGRVVKQLKALIAEAYGVYAAVLDVEPDAINADVLGQAIRAMYGRTAASGNVPAIKLDTFSRVLTAYISQHLAVIRMAQGIVPAPNGHTDNGRTDARTADDGRTADTRTDGGQAWENVQITDGQVSGSVAIDDDGNATAFLHGKDGSRIGSMVLQAGVISPEGEIIDNAALKDALIKLAAKIKLEWMQQEDADAPSEAELQRLQAELAAKTKLRRPLS